MEVDGVEVVDASSTVINNSKKRQRSNVVSEPDPSPKRPTRSSSRLANKPVSSNYQGITDVDGTSTTEERNQIETRSASSPALTMTDSGSVKLKLTSKVSLKLPSMKPTPMDQLVRSKAVESEKSTSWASLLDRKGLSPPKTKFASSSTASNSESATSPDHTAKTIVSTNPYAPAPGDPLHPFFMSTDARKAHAIKDNQQKLQSAVAKRQQEIRSQNKPGAASISAFFAPRVRTSPTTSSSPIDLDLRGNFVNFGSNLPEFPSIAHILPLSVDLPAISDETPLRSLESFGFMAEDTSNDEQTPPEFSLLLPAYQRYHSLDFQTPLVSLPLLEKPSTPPQGVEAPASDEMINKIATQLVETHLSIRRSLGMNVTTEPGLNRTKSAVEQVPLLDVRAEDMALHLALQQQAVAQRLVAEEEALIAASFFNPPYEVAEIEALYRVMAKQRELTPNLPWVTCYAPTQASQVCGNRHVATQVKDWLIRWQAAVEVLEAETPKRNDFFSKRSPVKPVEAPNPLESLVNTVVLAGPTGCGKTATVYAVANELGFEVLEVNASIKRTGSSLRTMIEEATQSRHLGRASNTLTILLFEEVDQQFDEDAGFFNALISICETAKRPIILTCHELPRAIATKVPKLALQEMKQPDEAAIFVHASLALLISGHSLPTPSLIHQFALWFNYDLRSILHNLQYWAHPLNQRHWMQGIRALAGLPLLPLPSTAHHFYHIQTPNAHVSSGTTDIQGPLSTTERMNHSVFLASESLDLPDPLNLLHHHYLSPLTLKSATVTESAPQNGSTHEMLELLSSAAMVSDVLSMVDAWSGVLARTDEADTQHDLGNEICAQTQLAAHLTVPDWSACLDDESCYSLGESTRQATTEALVSEVSDAMIFRSGSRLSRFEDLVGLCNIATAEDQQRLLNVKRRQYKSKVDWSRIKPTQRLLFIRALRLSEVPTLPSN